MTTLNRSLATALAAGTVLAAGCGSSDSSSSGSSAASAPSTSTAAATPGPKVAAGGKLALASKDFAFDAKEIQAKPGKLAVTLENMGPSPHEFVLLKSSAAPGSLPVKGGRVSEDTSVGEIAEIGSGAKGAHTFDLKAGTYVFVCNIPGHYGDGMRGRLTVG